MRSNEGTEGCGIGRELQLHKAGLFIVIATCSCVQFSVQLVWYFAKPLLSALELTWYLTINDIQCFLIMGFLDNYNYYNHFIYIYIWAERHKCKYGSDSATTHRLLARWVSVALMNLHLAREIGGATAQCEAADRTDCVSHCFLSSCYASLQIGVRSLDPCRSLS